MPPINTIRSALGDFPNGSPLVVVLTGGTTGIGSYIANALATTFAGQGPKLRVYIVGRNAARAEAVIANGRAVSPGSDWRFVQASDLALISEVDRSCASIIKRESEAPFHGGSARVDLLYMSHCYCITKPRSTTAEGLDAFISTTYYSRIRFVMQLMPLLAAAPAAGHVVSVYAGGFEDGTSAGELPIGCPPPSAYGIGGVRKHTSFMKTFLFEELAERHAGHLSLTHIFPGLVDGPVFYSSDMPTWFRIVWPLVKPLARLFMTPPDTCGQVMLYLGTARYPAKATSGTAPKPRDGTEVAMGTTGEVGGGAYTVGQRGDVKLPMSYEKVRTADTRKLVWDHTMETLERVAGQNAQQLK